MNICKYSLGSGMAIQTRIGMARTRVADAGGAP